MASTEQLYAWLEEVKDPEIPVLSLVDLGVISSIVRHDDGVDVVITPTFVGCPALDFMKHEIVESLERHGVQHVSVIVNYETPWTTERISENGRKALKTFGIAPPQSGLIDDISIIESVPCPRCESTNTELKNLFGPTLCRSIHYCLDCKNTFEQFKPV